METKWTKGPWRTGPTDDTLVTAGAGVDRVEVASMHGDYGNDDEWPVMEANARLIAAAPDLYEQLALIVRGHKSSVNGGFLTHEELEAAQAALAKARGEQC